MEETKRELPEGLYEITGQTIEGNPANLGGKMRRYLAPNTLGKAEDEEAAMRIIWPSIEQGQWVGVTWTYMVRQMLRERRASEALETEQMFRSKTQWLTVKAKRRRYLLLCLLTFGIYCLFAKWPKLVRLEVPGADDVPISVIPICGPYAIADSVFRLLERELITTRLENGVEIFFPTQELIDAVTNTVWRTKTA